MITCAAVSTHYERQHLQHCSCSHVHCSCSHVRCVLTVTTAGSSSTHGPQKEMFISTSTKTGSKCELITHIMTTTDTDGDDNDAVTPTTARNRLYLAHGMHTHTARHCRLHCTVHSRVVVVSLCLRLHLRFPHTTLDTDTHRREGGDDSRSCRTTSGESVHARTHERPHEGTHQSTHMYRNRHAHMPTLATAPSPKSSLLQ